MKVIGSGFVAEIGDPAARLAVLCRIIRRLNLEFPNGICPRAEFIQATSTEVVTADGDAVNKNLMAEELATVDGTRKCVAYGSWQTGENESLKLAPPITNFDGQRFKLLGTHGRAHLCCGGRE